MRQFPQALYRTPGTEQSDLGLFTSTLVHNSEQRDAHLAEGWHASREEALAADEAAKQAEQGEAEEKAEAEPVTREQLEQQARELGVDFSPKLGDKKLAERIAEKQAEQGA